MAPCAVVKVFQNGAVEIKNIDGQNSVFLVNGHRLKVYFQPLTKGDFIQHVQQQVEKELVGGNTNPLKI